MKSVISIGNQDFISIRKNNCFYIDKTDFIREWWENQDSVTLITRPRRFGKTLNMSMTEYFFSVNYSDMGQYFKELSIWKEERFREIQGTYPVISLSFADIKATTYESARMSIIRKLVRLYSAFDFIRSSEALNEKDRTYFDSVGEDMSDDAAAVGINYMSDYLSRYYGKKVIILLDEYDTPLQEAYVHGYWEELTAFIRSLFNSTFKTNPYMERGLLTGITRVSKESIFSDLNNLEVVTTTSEKYSTSFGFTEEEVFTVLENAGIPEEKADVISKNYDTKAKMLSEFQRGKTISLYKEKQAEKNSKYNTIVKEPEVKMESPKFIMLCGIPGSGKSQLAKSLYADLQNKKMDDVNLYPASKAIKNIGLIFDPSKITNDIVINADYKDSTVLISPNKIRQELKDNYPDSYSESLVFAIVDARIKTALKSGASVVYEATNLDKPIREKYLGIANEYGVKDTSLHVTWINPNDSISSISPNLLSAMNNRLVDSNPSKDEGWSDFVQHGMPAEKIQSNDYFDMSIDDDEIEYEDH